MPEATGCLPKLSLITRIVYFLNAYFHKDFLLSGEVDTHWHLAQWLTRCWNCEAIVLTMACLFFFFFLCSFKLGEEQLLLHSLQFNFFPVSNWQRQPFKVDATWKLSISFSHILQQLSRLFLWRWTLDKYRTCCNAAVDVPTLSPCVWPFRDNSTSCSLTFEIIFLCVAGRWVYSHWGQHLNTWGHL